MWNNGICSNWGAWGFHGGGIMWIAQVLLIAGIIYFLLHSFRRDNRKNEKSEALTILANRYAQGEISSEEFTARKKTLEL